MQALPGYLRGVMRVRGPHSHIIEFLNLAIVRQSWQLMYFPNEAFPDTREPQSRLLASCLVQSEQN